GMLRSALQASHARQGKENGKRPPRTTRDRRDRGGCNLLKHRDLPPPPCKSGGGSGVGGLPAKEERKFVDVIYSSHVKNDR
ncbi:MAG: hypothetical protein LBF89_11585, partial [Bacteroidales bacterium]|nr:hypothetical protein [Bacteroidales bacterium]